MQQQVISGTTGGNVYTYGGGGVGGELNPNSEYFVQLFVHRQRAQIYIRRGGIVEVNTKQLKTEALVSKFLLILPEQYLILRELSRFQNG